MEDWEIVMRDTGDVCKLSIVVVGIMLLFKSDIDIGLKLLGLGLLIQELLDFDWGIFSTIFLYIKKRVVK